MPVTPGLALFATLFVAFNLFKGVSHRGPFRAGAALRDALRRFAGPLTYFLILASLPTLVTGILDPVTVAMLDAALVGLVAGLALLAVALRFAGHVLRSALTGTA